VGADTGGRLERTLFIQYSIHPFSGYEVSHNGLTTTNLEVLNFELSNRFYALSFLSEIFSMVSGLLHFCGF
jgi:hypothetical protein